MTVQRLAVAAALFLWTTVAGSARPETELAGGIGAGKSLISKLYPKSLKAGKIYKFFFAHPVEPGA